MAASLATRGVECNKKSQGKVKKRAIKHKLKQLQTYTRHSTCVPLPPSAINGAVDCLPELLLCSRSRTGSRLFGSTHACLTRLAITPRISPPLPNLPCSARRHRVPFRLTTTWPGPAPLPRVLKGNSDCLVPPHPPRTLRIVAPFRSVPSSAPAPRPPHTTKL